MFNLPNLIRFVPWMLADHSVGLGGLGRLPNVTGRLTAGTSVGMGTNAYTASGALTLETQTTKRHRFEATTTAQDIVDILLDASGSNTLYTAETDRVVPAWTRMNFIIKYT